MYESVQALFDEYQKKNKMLKEMHPTARITWLEYNSQTNFPIVDFDTQTILKRTSVSQFNVCNQKVNVGNFQTPNNLSFCVEAFQKEKQYNGKNLPMTYMAGLGAFQNWLDYVHEAGVTTPLKKDVDLITDEVLITLRLVYGISSQLIVPVDNTRYVLSLNDFEDLLDESTALFNSYDQIEWVNPILMKQGENKIRVLM